MLKSNHKLKSNFRKSFIPGFSKFRLVISSLILVGLSFSFNGCMTMGWGGGNYGIYSESEQQTEKLVKEKEYGDVVLRAEFPKATTNRDLHYILNLKYTEASMEHTAYKVSMDIRREEERLVETSYIQLYPDLALSTNERFVFPYQFKEAGSYEITFNVSDSSGSQTEAVTTLSANRFVSKGVEAGRHHTGFYGFPWFAGGTVVMVGMMIWMMSF